jgi:hypothetical protein
MEDARGDSSQLGHRTGGFKWKLRYYTSAGDLCVCVPVKERELPYRFYFDSTHQILCAKLTGLITDERLVEFYQFATEHAARTNPRAAVIDFGAAIRMEISPQTVRSLAQRPPIMQDPRSPRIVVAPSPHVFGLARMFQFEGESTRPSLHVVRTWKEALAILGLQRLKFEPMPKP